jgi:hypothetical protein
MVLALLLGTASKATATSSAGGFACLFDLRHDGDETSMMSTTGQKMIPSTHRLAKAVLFLLRVCPETSVRITKFSEHKPD